MDLELMTRHNYFIKRNPQIDAYEIMRASRAGETVPVQTNIGTMEKAVMACEEWREREMHAALGELIGSVEDMMTVELARQQDKGWPEVDMKLMAAAAVMGLQVYIHNNKPLGKSN